MVKRMWHQQKFVTVWGDLRVLCFILLILLILSQNLPVLFFDCMDVKARAPADKTVAGRS
jgi:hypothetical protein